MSRLTDYLDAVFTNDFDPDAWIDSQLGGGGGTPKTPWSGLPLSELHKLYSAGQIDAATYESELAARGWGAEAVKVAVAQNAPANPQDAATAQAAAQGIGGVVTSAVEGLGNILASADVFDQNISADVLASNLKNGTAGYTPEKVYQSLVVNHGFTPQGAVDYLIGKGALAAGSTVPTPEPQPSLEATPGAAGAPTGTLTPTGPNTAVQMPQFPPGSEEERRAQWVAQRYQDALRWSQQTGIPPEVYVAINASESGFGGAPSVLFGMKGSGDAGTQSYATHEVNPDGSVSYINDNFASYSSPDAAHQAFVNLISGQASEDAMRRYGGAWAQYQQDGDWLKLLQGINAGGYATDPNWANMIAGLAQNVAGGSYTGGVAPAALAGAVPSDLGAPGTGLVATTGQQGGLIPASEDPAQLEGFTADQWAEIVAQDPSRLPDAEAAMRSAMAGTYTPERIEYELQAFREAVLPRLTPADRQRAIEQSATLTPEGNRLVRIPSLSGSSTPNPTGAGVTSLLNQMPDARGLVSLTPGQAAAYAIDPTNALVDLGGITMPQLNAVLGTSVAGPQMSLEDQLSTYTNAEQRQRLIDAGIRQGMTPEQAAWRADVQVAVTDLAEQMLPQERAAGLDRDQTAALLNVGGYELNPETNNVQRRVYGGGAAGDPNNPNYRMEDLSQSEAAQRASHLAPHDVANLETQIARREGTAEGVYEEPGLGFFFNLGGQRYGPYSTMQAAMAARMAMQNPGTMGQPQHNVQHDPGGGGAGQMRSALPTVSRSSLPVGMAAGGSLTVLPGASRGSSFDSLVQETLRPNLQREGGRGLSFGSSQATLGDLLGVGIGDLLGSVLGGDQWKSDRDDQLTRQRIEDDLNAARIRSQQQSYDSRLGMFGLGGPQEVDYEGRDIGDLPSFASIPGVRYNSPYRTPADAIKPPERRGLRGLLGFDDGGYVGMGNGGLIAQDPMGRPALTLNEPATVVGNMTGMPYAEIGETGKRETLIPDGGGLRVEPTGQDITLGREMTPFSEFIENIVMAAEGKAGKRKGRTPPLRPVGAP